MGVGLLADIEYRLYRNGYGEYTKIQFRVKNNNRYPVKVKIKDVEYESPRKTYKHSITIDKVVKPGGTYRGYSWPFGRVPFKQRPSLNGQVFVERR